MYEEHFPLTSEDGFNKASHCKEFACLLVDARENELKSGSVAKYKQACQAYWTLQNPPKPHPKSPMFNKETMPEVSTTVLCIINLTVQYFGLYTALVIVRTLTSLKVANLEGIQRLLESACTSVTYAPMLCVLFLGVRMRAIQLSQGNTEKYNLPQRWVQTSMVIASIAVVVQALLVLLVGFLSGATRAKTDEYGNLDVANMGDVAKPGLLKALGLVRYIIMAMLYGGFTAVVIGAFTMEGPKEIWAEEQLPVSPAVMCTILLSGLFFTVYLLVVAVTELSERLNDSSLLLKLKTCATQAKMTVNFAPMLCILFIGARMRALQIDPKHGNPQSWAQKCFFMCTCSVLLQAVLVIILPFVAKCECKEGAFQGDITFSIQNRYAGLALTGVRYVCLIALYGGIAAIVCSIYVIEHEDPAKTPTVSPAMQCVINLTMQYFFIYMVIFVVTTLRFFGVGNSAADPEQGFGTESRLSKGITKAIAIFKAATNTVMFAPMLAILFIAARMRALQLTKAIDGTISSQAGPQPWVQDAMFLATWAVFIQLVMSIAVPLLTGTEEPEVDADGNVKVPAAANKYLVISAEVVRYISLLFMYGGSMTVVVGIFMMTPDTLPPHSTQTLVPGTSVPRPPVPASAHGF